MLGLVPDHFEILIKCEDRERLDSRGIMTNWLLYSESLACKGLADFYSRFGTYEETGLDVPGMVGEAEWEADGY